MGSTAVFLLPTQPKPPLSEQKGSLFIHQIQSRKNRSVVPIARLFEKAIFEASKLKVLFIGVDERKHPGNIPRTYTLTHSDISSEVTLAISQTINSSQLRGWYNKLQRDEVLAEWKKVKGKISLHVHCHVSGGHFLLGLCARLRYNIFRKELPTVLKAFVHGDRNLFNNYPDLEEGLVWVYFHSNLSEFDRVECWGPLKAAAAPSDGCGGEAFHNKTCSSYVEKNSWVRLQPCEDDCTCCFPPMSLIPWPEEFLNKNN